MPHGPQRADRLWTLTSGRLPYTPAHGWFPTRCPAHLLTHPSLVTIFLVFISIDSAGKIRQGAGRRMSSSALVARYGSAAPYCAALANGPHHRLFHARSPHSPHSWE